MSIKVVKFNVNDQPEFFKELRSRVNQYFKDNNISKYANFNMKVKTAFMLALYFVPMGMMIFGFVSSVWPMILMWTLMGLGMAGLGLSVMHDANHGAYSKNKKVNKTLGFVLNFIGGFPVNWKIQHNVLHHSFTNVEGHDEDIVTPTMRFSPSQKMRKIFKFQAFYAPFLYGLMTVYWFLVKDFEQLIRYNKMNLLEGQGLEFKRAMRGLIFNKIWYAGLTLILPIIIVDLPWWQVLLGFMLMEFICGLILALIFQPAHVIQETSFYEPDETGSVENNWAIHQMKTTSNFANGSRWFSWFVGGLNFQIEHHLFPNICHVHYRKISKIVRETAKEYGVPYYHHKTFFAAVKSHLSVIHQLGNDRYKK